MTTTQAADLPADGDDIVVVPGGPDEPRGRQLLLIIGAAVAGIAVIVVVIALLTRHDGQTPQVAVEPPKPSVPVARTPARPKPKPKAQPRLPSVPPPTFARSTVPLTNPATPVSSPPVVASPPATGPAPTVPLAPPKQYGAAALTWDAPHLIAIPSGRTATLTVMAFNRTDGVVNLPHPLSCTPRIDHQEVCAEMVQTIAPGGSASATYTIDAAGIRPGDYRLQIEGVLTVEVTVS